MLQEFRIPPKNEFRTSTRPPPAHARTRSLPPFRNTYSALNALAGHYNSFGAQAPIPKKRLERLVKVR